MTSAKDELSQYIDAVQEEYNADIYIYSGEIDDVGYGKLIKEIVNPEPRPNGLLILTTNGGSGGSAYKIARLFHKTYQKFILYTPTYCKSAGTLIALGAHEIIMDVFSELGPLDVQLPTRDELWEHRSGLISRSAFNSLTEASFEMYQQFMLAVKYKSLNKISFKLASEISSRMTCELMSPIYAQLNPDIIGSDFRDLNVAMEYGKRLSTYSKNTKSLAVMHLVRGYPSHDFIIDEDEARNLFESVTTPANSLYELLNYFGDIAFEEQEPTTVFALRRVCEADDEMQGETYAREPARSAENTARMDANRQDDRASNSGASEDAGSEEGNSGKSEGISNQEKLKIQAA